MIKKDPDVISGMELSIEDVKGGAYSNFVESIKSDEIREGVQAEPGAVPEARARRDIRAVPWGQAKVKGH